MGLECTLLARGGGGPDPHRSTGTAARHAAAARGYAERARCIRLPAPGAYQATHVRAPQPDAAILARGNEQARPAGTGECLRGVVLALEHRRGLRTLGDVEQGHRAR